MLFGVTSKTPRATFPLRQTTLGKWHRDREVKFKYGFEKGLRSDLKDVGSLWTTPRSSSASGGWSRMRVFLGEASLDNTEAELNLPPH